MKITTVLILAVALLALLFHVDAKQFKWNVTISTKELLKRKQKAAKEGGDESAEKKDQWGRRLVKKVKKEVRKIITTTTTPVPPIYVPAGIDPCSPNLPPICKNNATCRSEKNQYRCECTPAFWGPNCQYLADMSSCNNGNLCANDARCFSILDSHLEMNPKYNVTFDEDGITPVTQAGVPEYIDVKYVCVCKPGYSGFFCDFDQKDHDECRYGKCSGFGRGKNGMVGPNCECDCDDDHFGDRCEYISPCRDMFCTNNSTCAINGVGSEVEGSTARCECPTRIEHFGAVSVYGDDCETIEVPESVESDPNFPCRNNSRQFLSALYHHMHPFYIENKDSFEGNCLHEGECEVIIGSNLSELIKGTQKKIYFLPQCLCPADYRGQMCERRIPNFCDAPAGQPPICGAHGDCSYTEVEGFKCRCHQGFTGNSCNLRNPCDPNPCLNGTSATNGTAPSCVPLRNVHVGEVDDSQAFECYCSAMQKKNNAICENYATCSTEKAAHCANNSTCMPCEKEGDNPLCYPSDFERGFRCYCQQRHQFLPFCKKNPHPCEAHQCVNGGLCEQVDQNSTDYNCHCQLGYGGKRCGEITDVCKAIGDKVCQHGTCERIVTGKWSDKVPKRDFRCVCEDEWAGRNCEQVKKQKGYFDWLWNDWLGIG